MKRYKLLMGVTFVLLVLVAAVTSTVMAYDHKSEESVGPCTGRSDRPHYSAPPPALDLSAHGWTICTETQPLIWVNTGLWKWTVNGNSLIDTDTQDNSEHPTWTTITANPRGFCVNGKYFTFSNHKVIDDDGDEFTAGTTSQPLPTTVTCS